MSLTKLFPSLIGALISKWFSGLRSTTLHTYVVQKTALFKDFPIVCPVIAIIHTNTVQFGHTIKANETAYVICQQRDACLITESMK